MTTPHPGRGRWRHTHKNNWGDGKVGTEKRLGDSTKYGKKNKGIGIHLGMFGKNVYICGRNVHVEGKKRMLADVCKTYSEIPPHFRRKKMHE